MTFLAIELIDDLQTALNQAKEPFQFVTAFSSSDHDYVTKWKQTLFFYKR